MSRRHILSRLGLSAIMASGCSPDQDSQLPILEVSHSSFEPPAAPSNQHSSQTNPSDFQETTPHLYSLHRHVWVRAQPSSQSPWLGFLGLGGSVALRNPEPIPGPGCNQYYPIEPRGYVCLDHWATLDPHSSVLDAIRAIAPRRDQPWLHNYAESRQAPRYETLPTREQQRLREFQLDRHLETVASLRNGDFLGEVPVLLRDVDVAFSGIPIPGFLDHMPRIHENTNTLKAGSTLSYGPTFDAEGRTWFVTGDGLLIPKDRVAPYPKSTFQGVQLEPSSLPLGFVRERSRPRYVMKNDGTIVSRGSEWPRLASFGLRGRRIEQDGTEYIEAQDGSFVRRGDVIEVRASPRTPWGEAVDAEDLEEQVRWSHVRSVPPPGPRSTWVQVSVHGGWMIAYEGTRPVFATLVATGRGEPVAPGATSLQTSTPPGIFSIQGKYWTSNMAVNSTAHFDVPFAMPYSGAYALHAAYWHEKWGEKVSLGCVNLSPKDARWLFLWAEPSIPEGWHGVRVTKETGHATVVVVHA